MEPSLAFLETLARHAGQILRAGLGQAHQIDYKGTIDLVTEMDHRSESFLLEKIRGQFPSHRIITEEQGDLEGDAQAIWYIDPLDGTVNYAHGLPIFAVSIALALEGQVRRGVVYDPMQEECFTAERGQGAWLNGKPIRASQADKLDQSLLVTGFPYDIRTNPENNLDHYIHFSLHSQGVRRLGSAALDLCYVGCGRFEGFWEVRIKTYDIAAGGLIAEEAGAKVTNLRGEADYMTPPNSILAATQAIHPQMLAALNQRA